MALKFHRKKWAVSRGKYLKNEIKFAKPYLLYVCCVFFTTSRTKHNLVFRTWHKVNRQLSRKSPKTAFRSSDKPTSESSQMMVSQYLHFHITSLLFWTDIFSVSPLWRCASGTPWRCASAAQFPYKELVFFDWRKSLSKAFQCILISKVA